MKTQNENQKAKLVSIGNEFLKGKVAIFLLITAAFLFFMAITQAKGQKKVYNECRAQNAVYEDAVDRKSGEVHKVKVEADQHGNAQGNQYDLAVDGAFEGETVAVLHLYTGEGFDFSLPKAALKEKGFSVYRWIDNPPSPKELEEQLKKACQLWIISSNVQKLNEGHLKVIKKFFDSGKGVYIWGDNDPYYADANYVAEYLFDVKMLGNLPGDVVVGLNNKGKNVGLMPKHLITTGLEYVYEGITIATVQETKLLKPLIYGHEGNLVAAFYDQGGKRAILDGGFTRLYYSWDHAGTGRYVKNAAAWLVNYERFAEVTK
ncbi:MAG: hypothetical protein P1P88_17205 [Bacteroidales bacterium]|nr:hypothetical protein [Bacteroidales bacterium]